MAEADATNKYKTIGEIETSEDGVARRWLSEIALAQETFRAWKEDARKCWELYQSKKTAENQFNIFWSNVETRRQAVYNSTPRPDVRRRFRDPDPVGKVASNVLERALAYSIDDYDFDTHVEAVVLDVEVTGRGVARVKYDPTFVKSSTPEENSDDEAEEGAEEVYSEKVPCNHVQWDDFLHGAAKEWCDVPWVAFRHQFHYDEIAEMFGRDVANAVDYTEPESEAAKGFHEDMKTLLVVCEVWEIWEKDTRNVFFISDGFKQGPMKVVEDPLRLEGFFPVGSPVFAIEDSTTLVPGVPYRKYEEQAKELNRTTYRINKIIDSLKVRGAYSATLSELPQILEAEDQDFIPIQNESQVANMGGLDKAIWIMPIEKLVTVLKELIAARAAIIQTIYEITGMGDIIRGVSNPHETAHAQDLKSQWGSLRLQREQRDIQRFVRDIFRLKAEIMSEHFSAEQLAGMTGIQLPTAEEKEKVQKALQEMQQQAQQQPEPGQPPPQPPDPLMIDHAQEILKLPTWAEVMKLLKSDDMRQYRIDIETDSTIAETIQQDTQGLQEAVTAISALATAFGPAIQMGVLSVDVFKTIATRIARTIKMGEAVEDAIDSIKQPPPQQAPAEQDNSVQVAQIKEQGAAKRNTENNQTKLQLSSQQKQSDQVAQQIEAMKLQFEERDNERQRQHEMQLEHMKMQNEAMIAQMEAKFDAAIQMQQGQMQQQTAMAQTQSAERQNMAKIDSGERTTAATLHSNEKQTGQKTQSSNMQAAAKIESSDHQTQVKARSAEEQSHAKIRSSEKTNTQNNQSAERLASAKAKAKSTSK